jgi:hypothetical protein
MACLCAALLSQPLSRVFISLPLRIKMRGIKAMAHVVGRARWRLKYTPLRAASVFAASAARDEAVVFLRCPLAFFGN